MVRRIHSDESYESVMNVSEILFNRKASSEKLKSMTLNELLTISQEIPSFELDKKLIQNGVNVVDLISDHTTIVNSKSEARRTLKGNALSVNKIKITDFDFVIDGETLLQKEYIMIENGKKNKFIIKVV